VKSIQNPSALQKNEIYTTEITDLTPEGNGVCHIQGMAVFVPHTAPGDQLQVKIVKVLKQYAFGIAVKIETPAACRITPDCSFSACGGCTFRHITYAAELQWKEKLVQDAFHRIGKLQPTFLPILGGEHLCHYRNKAQYPVAMNPDGKPVCGFYAKRSHRVIPVRDCKLQPVIFQQVLDVILQYVQEQSISIYQEETGIGILRHIYLRQGWHTGELMVCLVVRKPIARQLKGLVKRLVSAFPQIKSIVMNCNPARTNVILGEKTELLWGMDTITDILCDNRISLSACFLSGKYSTGRTTVWCCKAVCRFALHRNAAGFVLRCRHDWTFHGRCSKIRTGGRNCSAGSGKCQRKRSTEWYHQCRIFMRRCRNRCSAAGAGTDAAGCDCGRPTQKGM